MKRILYFQIMMLALSLLNTGCLKDNSTGTQREMPNIELDLKNIGRRAYVGEEFRMFVPIIWNDEDSTAFEYKWVLNQEEVSSEREFVYTFTETGNPWTVFQVIERATGLTVSQSFSITVSSRYFVGWLILSDKGGRSGIDFIDVDSLFLYDDLYNKLYPDDPLGSEPYRLAEQCGYLSDQIMVFQRGGPGSVVLDGNNYEKVVKLEEEFIGEKFPYDGFYPVDAYYTNIECTIDMVLTDKGEAYSRINANYSGSSEFQSAQYPLIPLEYPDGRGMEITHYTFPALTGFLTLFDGLNNRWLGIKKVSSPSAIDEMLPPWEKDFDPSDPALTIEGPRFFDFCEGMGDNIEMIYCQNCNEAYTPYLVNIIKDTDTGIYYFQKVIVKYESSPRQRVVVSSPTQRVFAAGYAIDDESVFCLLRGKNTPYENSPHVFFTIGHKMYVYREQSEKYHLFMDFDAVDNPPSGEVVAIMHSPVYKSSEYHQNIAVAFSDGHFFIMNCTSIMGAISRGDLDPSNPADIEEIVLAHHSGLGEIKHALFKYARSWNLRSEIVTYR